MWWWESAVLGDRKMISELGEDYTTLLRSTYEGRVPAAPT